MKKLLKSRKSCVKGQFASAFQAILIIIGILLGALAIAFIVPRFSIGGRLLIYAQAMQSKLAAGEYFPVPSELYTPPQLYEPGKLYGVNCKEDLSWIMKELEPEQRELLAKKCIDYDYLLVLKCCNSVIISGFQKELNNFELKLEKGALYYDPDSKTISIKKA